MTHLKSFIITWLAITLALMATFLALGVWQDGARLSLMVITKTFVAAAVFTIIPSILIVALRRLFVSAINKNHEAAQTINNYIYAAGISGAVAIYLVVKSILNSG